MSTLIRWNPVRELANMQSTMDRIFDETWRGVSNNVPMMVLDVHEADDAYTILANVPGLNPDDITINLHEGELTITAEVSRPEVDENVRVIVQERGYGQFTRRITLRHPVDEDNVDATYDNGVLTLMVPKVPEAQPRQIPVRVTSNS